jgi:predicted RNA-binding Zn ribbon-like protein
MPHHSPAIFIADATGLDFLNSVATPADVQIDWISDGDGLLAWLAQARLVPPEVLASIRKRAVPGEIDRVASRARGLREWFRSFVRAHQGKPLKAADLEELEPLNRLLERDEGFEELVAQKQGSSNPFQLQRSRRWHSPESLLLPIAEALAKFVSEEDFSDIRACAGTTCTLIFVDHTRGRSRRWCSMGICGNRAKQTAHRHRLKDQQ